MSWTSALREKYWTACLGIVDSGEWIVMSGEWELKPRERQTLTFAVACRDCSPLSTTHQSLYPKAFKKLASLIGVVQVARVVDEPGWLRGAVQFDLE